MSGRAAVRAKVEVGNTEGVDRPQPRERRGPLDGERRSGSRVAPPACVLVAHAPTVGPVTGPVALTRHSGCVTGSTETEGGPYRCGDEPVSQGRRCSLVRCRGARHDAVQAVPHNSRGSPQSREASWNHGSPWGAAVSVPWFLGCRARHDPIRSGRGRRSEYHPRVRGGVSDGGETLRTPTGRTWNAPVIPTVACRAQK